VVHGVRVLEDSPRSIPTASASGHDGSALPQQWRWPPVHLPARGNVGRRWCSAAVSYACAGPSLCTWARARGPRRRLPQSPIAVHPLAFGHVERGTRGGSFMYRTTEPVHPLARWYENAAERFDLVDTGPSTCAEARVATSSAVRRGPCRCPCAVARVVEVEAYLASSRSIPLHGGSRPLLSVPTVQIPGPSLARGSRFNGPLVAVHYLANRSIPLRGGPRTSEPGNFAMS